LKHTVVITSDLPPVATSILAGEFDVIAHPTENGRTEDDMIAILAEADAAITLLSDPITRPVLESNPNLRIVANYAVGYDNVDLAAANELGVVVTNTPGVLTESTADLTMALILATTRRLVEADAEVRRSGRADWAPLAWLGSSLQGKQLGIVGMGRIGFAVATRARAFGMSIAYDSRTPKPESEAQHGSRRVGFDELVATSDVVSIHCPLNDATRHLIGAAAFHRMKPTAFLVNTARGPIVDQEALCEALQSRAIAGAGLDVFEFEPEVDQRLRRLHNAVLLPHIGSATIETRSEMARIAATDIARFLQGLAPLHAVASPR
jgi:glyoxylate reductase